MITVQFSGTNHIASRVIQYTTNSWANHVDFVLPDGVLLGAVAVANKLNGAKTKSGVVYHDMYPLNKYERVERYEVDAPDTVLDYAISQLGKPYDWRGVLNIVIRNEDWFDDQRWFCSELIAAAFEHAESPLVRGVASRITPAILLFSTRLRLIHLPFDLTQ